MLLSRHSLTELLIAFLSLLGYLHRLLGRHRSTWTRAPAREDEGAKDRF